MIRFTVSDPTIVAVCALIAVIVICRTVRAIKKDRPDA